MNTDVDEKVRKFYKLKEQYENERRATATSNKSKQFKCISCRRLVGSTFKHIANADGTRNLFAVCGDTITPCKLNINIHLGATVNNEDEMIMYKKKISELKKNIILGKNDLLFGYVSRENALENFNKLKEDLTRDTDIYEKELQLYTNTVNNLDKITKTIETQNKITDTVTDFQNLIRQYAKTSEQSFINDSIDMYINTLLPELHAYKELTIPLSAKDFEMNYDDPRVISDEFGPIISSKNTTIKRKAKSKKTLTQKTRDWPESPEDSPPSVVNYSASSKKLLLESDILGTPPLPPTTTRETAAPPPPPKSANPASAPPTTIVQHIYSPTPISIPSSSQSSYFSPYSSPHSSPPSSPRISSSNPPSSSPPPSSEPTTTTATDELIEFDGPTVSNLEENSYDLNPHD